MISLMHFETKFYRGHLFMRSPGPVFTLKSILFFFFFRKYLIAYFFEETHVFNATSHCHDGKTCYFLPKGRSFSHIYHLCLDEALDGSHFLIHFQCVRFKIEFLWKTHQIFINSRSI